MRFCPRCGSRYQHERFCPEDGAATEPLPEAGPPQDALVGALIDDRYRIEGPLGEGGMGVVYKARHVALNKPLALKVLRGEVAKDADVVRRFMQEAQAATSIGHENIVDISDFGRLPDDTAYFVMEFIDGQPLGRLIKRGGSIPTGAAIAIIRQIASALGAAHERGIVHRDLKPDNVMVLTRGELENFVKVLDFGIAKVGTKNKITRTGVVFGTPHYMSPEQAAGQSVDARTDIYALGVIMYQMFTGRVPFDADTFMAVLTKHMFEKPAPFGPAASRQLGALEEITLRALEKKPEDRYASMPALLADLDRVMGGGKPAPREARRPSQELADALEPRSKSERNLEVRLAGEAAEGDDPRTRSEPRLSTPELPGSRRWPYVAGSFVALLGLVVLMLALRRGGSHAASAPSAPVPMLPSATEPAPSELPRGLGDPAAQLDEVVLESVPSGAEVLLDGNLVGRTPTTLIRPTEGDRALELRLAGFSLARARLAHEGPSRMRVVLKRTASLSTKKPAAQPLKTRGRSDVIDPWGD
ncbi:MAG: serine/threonine-protein kinase [Polyangiales bacterium]